MSPEGLSLRVNKKMHESSSGEKNAVFWFKGSRKEEFPIYRASLKAKLRINNLWSVFCDEMKYGEMVSSSDQYFSQDKPTIVNNDKKSAENTNLRE